MRRESAIFSIPGAAYFLHLCDTAGVAVLSVDGDLTIRYCNDKTAGLLGRRIEGVVGASLKDVLGRPDGAVMERLARRAIQRGECGATEFRWQNPDGSHQFLAATLSPIRDDREFILGASVCFQDITHCIQLQDQLGQARKMRALGTMAGKFAHHFNNILGSVVTSVDFAKQCGDMRVMRKTMHSVARSLQRATTLLDELLAFAEADYRDTDLADLTETILRFADDIKPTLDARNVEFDLKLARVPVIEVPRTPFLTVLSNLAGNAVDAMVHGGRLSFELAAKRDHVVCRIVDTGQGIVREDLEHVFEPFYSTKNPELGAGTGRHHGLGLSVALGIVHDMGGDITVSSIPERMTTIEIRLPVDPSHPLRPEWQDDPEHLGR
jgi:polar amino acid transport system substrate-binding protein